MAQDEQQQEQLLDQIFLDDIKGHMATIAHCVTEMEFLLKRGQEVSEALLTTLMRGFHTVKACADFDNIHTLAQVAHNSEDLLEFFLKTGVQPMTEQVDLLYDVIDFAQQLTSGIEIPPEPIERDADELIQRINLSLGQLGAAEHDGDGGGSSSRKDVYLSSASDELDEYLSAMVDERDDAKLMEPLAQLNVARSALIAMASGDASVETATQADDALDQYLGDARGAVLSPEVRPLLQDIRQILAVCSCQHVLPNEDDAGVLSDVLIVVRNSIAAGLAGRMGNQQGFAALREMLTDIRWHLRVNLPRHVMQFSDCRDEGMTLKQLGEHVVRVTKHFAKELGCQVEVKCETDDSAVDGERMQALHEMLVHLLRNALDHGVESPDERRRAGKPIVGHIGFKAVREQGVLQLRVSDDGRGLQRAAILRKLGRPAGGTQHEAQVVFDAVTCAGFSTTDAPTLYSGRGMGMHIVRQRVEELGGSMTLNSSEHRGTVVNIRLPMKEQHS